MRTARDTHTKKKLLPHIGVTVYKSPVLPLASLVNMRTGSVTALPMQPSWAGSKGITEIKRSCYRGAGNRNCSRGLEVGVVKVIV